MTARRTGPRATKGSKTRSRPQGARKKTGAGKKAPARKKSAASKTTTGAAKRSPTRSKAASKKAASKKAASKKTVAKKSVRKKAAKAKATGSKAARKKTAKKKAARARTGGKPIARRVRKAAASATANRGTAARTRPTNPRGFRISATLAREVGRIDRAYARAQAAVLELSGELRVGDWIAVRGTTTDFTQRVESLRLEGRSVENAGAGDTVGIATSERTRVGDRVERLDP